MTIRSMCIMLLAAACAVAVCAEFLPKPVRVRLKDGRTFDCTLLQRTEDGILIERRIGTSIAREPHRVEQIDSIQFPLPTILTSINVRAMKSKDELRSALREIKAEYAAWQQFEDIKGHHAVAVLKLYAEVLEHLGSYATAHRMFRRLLNEAGDEETRRYAAQRLAVCEFWSSTNGAALAALTNALAAATSDAERAELLFCIGVSHAQRGEPVAALFSLLKNSVFYSMHGTWEPRSLAAALAPFASLGRHDEFLTTCATLTQRFDGTVWAALAHDRLAALNAGTNLSTLSSITTYLEEP